MPLYGQLPAIRKAFSAGRILWKRHALERMMERGISRNMVEQAVATGEPIEQYPDDYPIPSLLIAAFEPEPLHVVLAWNQPEAECYLITVYKPDPEHFEADLKTRRKS